MTRTVSGIGVAGLLVLSNGEDPKLLRIEGYCGGVAGTQYWLQIHNAAPAGGAAPLRSLQVLGSNGFTFDYSSGQGVCLENVAAWAISGGLYVALSSTDATYTAPGITADINVDIEEFELELAGQTNVASGATAGGLKTILATGANNTQALLSLAVTETGGVASFIQIFAKSPVLNDVPLEQFPLAANATVNLKFGSTGRAFYQQGNAGTLYKGIYIGISRTTGVFDTAGTANVGGNYK